MATNLPVWAAENLTLSASTEISNEGYFVLSWAPVLENANLTLQQSASEDFTSPVSRNLEAVNAVTITGLDDGVYFYRITDNDQVVSNLVAVDVQHHSLRRAGGFFLLGLLLFATLICSILIGNRRAGI